MNIIWQPQPGGQELFLQCPVYECLAEGNRGGGKSEALLADFGQFVGCGYGEAWRGILFRRTYNELRDITSKAVKLFSRVFPDSRFLESKNEYVFPDGEILFFRYMERPSDYWSYHGHEYPWLAFEELTTWNTAECYGLMKSCCRSSHKTLPRHCRATTNPYGVGMSWVKSDFIDPITPGQIVTNDMGEERTRIRMFLHENKVLMDADPEYLKKLLSIKDPMLRRAWLFGDWDIVSGGALDDVWNRSIHIMRPFAIPPTWEINRSFDWGSSKPFSVGWWAESNGESVKIATGESVKFPKGTLFRIMEWYGMGELPNTGIRMLAKQIAQGIHKIEKSVDMKVKDGPADPSIFSKVNGMSIAKDMYDMGIKWQPADNTPGSRKLGLEKLRQYLGASLFFPRMEEPGMFIFDTCKNFIRTVPTLMRDDKHLDDVDTNQEDHCYDETRYRVYTKKRRTMPVSSGL